MTKARLLRHDFPIHGLNTMCCKKEALSCRFPADFRLPCLGPAEFSGPRKMTSCRGCFLPLHCIFALTSKRRLRGPAAILFISRDACVATASASYRIEKPRNPENRRKIGNNLPSFPICCQFFSIFSPIICQLFSKFSYFLSIFFSYFSGFRGLSIL